jgi:hypothetical protein
LSESQSDFCYAQNITKTLNRQSKDEKYQLKKLADIFTNIKYTGKRSKYHFYNGKHFIGNSPHPKSKDVDAISDQDSIDIWFTLKGGQKITGGAQFKQFQDVESTIEHCIVKSEDGPLLAVYIEGTYWTDKHSKFKGYESSYNLNTHFSYSEVLSIFVKKTPA